MMERYILDMFRKRKNGGWEYVCLKMERNYMKVNL